jgi:muramoyltetrapeptide carboxypeptidase LdcA involved in peptidoglycan recycling
MEIRIPSPLKKGSIIGVTAPSFGCTTEPYRTKFFVAKKRFEEKGYGISAGKTVFSSDGKGISTDPEFAAEELQEFYRSRENSAVISAGGGELMCETAGFVDFASLKNCDAKWFLGYSDNTNFIFPLVTISRTAAIYGPTFTGFGKKWERTENDSLSILEGNLTETRGFDFFQRPEDDDVSAENAENFTYNLREKKILTISGGKNHAEFSGVLLGGCLDVLANLCGTHLDEMKKFNAEFKKIVWVLESCDGNPCEIRRQIWHLKNASWFDSAAGFLIGRPLASFREKMFGIDRFNAVTDLLGEFGVPVVLDADVGHIDPVMPLVMGKKATVTVHENDLKINYTGETYD